MCTACEVNANATDEFGNYLLDVLNYGGTALMLSIGHRTGLFDVMSTMVPATSHEIAKAAGLNERYVREWLGAMTTARIVTCNPEGPRYHLPAEHAALLTREAGADNIAVFYQHIAGIAGVESEIVECFRSGGGVPYSKYPRFHEVMAEDSGQSVMHSLIDVILPIVPGIIEALESGIDVLDIGCGRGMALNLMARTFPNSRFTGMDLSEDAIYFARETAAANGTTNVQFIQKDLSTFDEDATPAAFDFVTAFDAIHDQARPDRVLAGIRNTLRPGGQFLMQDIGLRTAHHENMNHPMAPFIYTISTMHCMTVSLAQGGMGLGAAWGVDLAEQMLREAGFTTVDVKNLEHDFQNSYFIAQ